MNMPEIENISQVITRGNTMTLLNINENGIIGTDNNGNHTKQSAFMNCVGILSTMPVENVQNADLFMTEQTLSFLIFTTETLQLKSLG